MIYSGTGHRPDKVGGYGVSVHKRLVDLARAFLRKFRPDEVISGMALGWDIALALASLTEDIPLTATLPFKNQDAKWLKQSRDIWQDAVSRAKKVIIVSEGGYTPAKMMIRNKYLVDNCDRVVALYNGDKTGGTANCIEYAIMKQKPITNLWNSWTKYGNLHSKTKIY